MSAVSERQWLPDPPAPWFWELLHHPQGGEWVLARQDPHEGLVVACSVQRWTIGDNKMLSMILETIENLPPTYIAKSHDT